MIRQHSHNITREKERETNINETQNITYIKTKLTSPSPYKYINSINKTNQMTANVQAMSIIISKLSKIMSN
jgi:hypothetical protein